MVIYRFEEGLAKTHYTGGQRALDLWEEGEGGCQTWFEGQVASRSLKAPHHKEKWPDKASEPAQQVTEGKDCDLDLWQIKFLTSRRCPTTARISTLASSNPKKVPDNIRYKFATKHPASSMMLGLIGPKGKKIMSNSFPVGTKVNSDEYWHAPKTFMKPWIQRLCGITMILISN